MLLIHTLTVCLFNVTGITTTMLISFVRLMGGNTILLQKVCGITTTMLISFVRLMGRQCSFVAESLWMDDEKY